MIRMILKNLLKKTPLYHPLKLLKQKIELREWEKKGRPVPPPHFFKQRVLVNYAERYNLKIFVESGTYCGYTVEAMKNIFDKIYSIEISLELFQKAKDHFRFENNIELIHGDSGKVMENLIKKINQPALFWLDAHYDEDTPIYKELGHILHSKDSGHVIIIDDARHFGTNPAYPTIDELKKFVCSKRQNIKITIEDDIIRIVPNVM